MSKKLILGTVVSLTLAAGAAGKAKAEKSPIDLGVNAKVENVISTNEKATDSAINYVEAQNQLAQKEKSDSLEAERQKVKEFFHKTLVEYSQKEFETDSTGELWKKLAPYFAEPPCGTVVMFVDGSVWYSPEDLFGSHFSEYCKVAHRGTVDMIKEGELSFVFEEGSDRIKGLRLDLRRFNEKIILR